jgi:hypothetical protein
MMDNFKQFMNQLVLVTTIKGAKYCGVLNGIREKQRKIHLTNLMILTKSGGYKAQSLKDNKRWFNYDSIRKIEVVEGGSITWD